MTTEQVTSNVLNFSDADFAGEVLQSKQPVLVDVYADWCPPCRALAPTVEELAGEFAGRVKVGKLNTDANPETPARYEVRSIPTLLLFEKGEVVQRFVGLTSKKDLAAALDGVLG